MSTVTVFPVVVLIILVWGPPLCLSWVCSGPPAGAPRFLWAHAAYLKPLRHSLGAQVTRDLGLARGCCFGHTAPMLSTRRRWEPGPQSSRFQAVELGTATPLSAQEGPHRPWGEVMCHPRVGGWARVYRESITKND